ncbi:MAG: LysR family transcriptional regulator [Loktanella sp.]|nr:LysR family transcriptional regulator [Loktanella sp.]
MASGLDFSMLSRLRFRQLALVIALSETSNLHAAAREVSLSQPGATKMLKELESTLGVLLFDRLPRGMIPTRAGEEVVRSARLILSNAIRMRDTALAVQSGTSGAVRLGAIMAAVPNLIVDLVENIMAEAPALTLDLRVVTSDLLVEGLVEGALDLGIGRPVDIANMAGIRFEPLLTEDLAIVAAPGHQLTTTKNLHLQDLTEMEWILQPRPSPMRASIDLAFSREGLPPPRHRVETSSTLATTVLLENDRLLAVLPASIADYCARHRLLKVLPVDLPSSMGGYGLIYPDNGSGTDIAVSAIAIMIRRLAAGRWQVTDT